MRVEIRKATAVDAVQIKDLIRSAYAKAMARIPDLPDVAGGVPGQIETLQVWVADDGEALQGVVIFSAEGLSAHLMNVATGVSARGTGLGRRLIEHAKDVSRGLGAKHMVLATHADLPENVAIYEKLGWRVSGREGNKVMMEIALLQK